MSALRKWTRERVIAEICARAVDGKPPGYADEPALAGAAQREFASWRNAVVAAGLTPRRTGEKRKRRADAAMHSDIRDVQQIVARAMMWGLTHGARSGEQIVAIAKEMRAMGV
ncbi:MAG: hypothetical protein KGL39_17410 [Patescibacteria group bacterium]|nr:hypothetical protein [Patescibacteria group bacterium]